MLLYNLLTTFVVDIKNKKSYNDVGKGDCFMSIIPVICYNYMRNERERQERYEEERRESERRAIEEEERRGMVRGVLEEVERLQREFR